MRFERFKVSFVNFAISEICFVNFVRFSISFLGVALFENRFRETCEILI